MNPLTKLRLLLAQEKVALRDATDDYKVIKARAEQRAIEGGVNGKNADERERNLLVALQDNENYQEALITLRQCEADIDRTEAQIESLLDDRRSYEWAIRSALVDALGGAGKDDGAAFDGALDAFGGDPDAGRDPDPDADLQAERYTSNFSATLRRQYPPTDTREWFGK
jgi:hypothetical protein